MNNECSKFCVGTSKVLQIYKGAAIDHDDGIYDIDLQNRKKNVNCCVKRKQIYQVKIWCRIDY